MRRLLVCGSLIAACRIPDEHFTKPGDLVVDPGLVDVGNVLLGASGTAHSPLSADTSARVDLVVSPDCTDTAAGTFTLDPKTNIDLLSAVILNVSYTPIARGTRECRVDIVSTGTTDVLGSFDVRATGQVPPAIAVTATTSFDNVRFNNSAVLHTSSQSFVVTNTGDADLDVTNVAFGGLNAGDFTIVSGGLSAMVLPGNAHTWVIAFDPTGSGSRSGTVSFASNDPTKPTMTLSLSGSGTNGVIAVNDQNFGIVQRGSSSSLDLTIQNTASAPKGDLGVTAATISGAFIGLRRRRLVRRRAVTAG